MPLSQNGWPVASAEEQDRDPIFGNVKVPNGVLKGDVAIIFRYVAKRFDETVESLRAGTCWGWFVKKIEGSNTYSNHASGTAIDLNADRHPMGIPASQNMTPRQIAACRQIVADCEGVIRWGGDYSGRPDPMHWEINAGKTAVHNLAGKLSGRNAYKMSISLEGFALPELKQGDDDSKMAGPHYVTRAQMLLNYVSVNDVTIDGVYGPQTAASVKALSTDSDGKTLGLAEWTQLYGLSKNATK